MTTKIELPPAIAGLSLPLVVSVSGGKDSTACMIALREAGLPFRAVFADTGWEAPETYAYLDTLRGIFGPIDVVQAASKGTGEASAMRDRIIARAGFPARKQRWCSRELKIDPIRLYHDMIGEDAVSVVGLRAEESDERARLRELDDDDDWGGWVWRPLIAWSERDVFEAHRRANVPLNPLYERGHNRVGCYPCIYSRKEEIRLIADYHPERIDEIEELESWASRERVARNDETPGRYGHTQATFFLARERGKGAVGLGIRESVEWSRTSRGGRQLRLLPEPPGGGCFRLGFCERPRDDAEEEK